MKKSLMVLLFLVCTYFSWSQTILIQENFTSYLGTAVTVPTGWIFTYNGNYTSVSNSGTSGINSYKFGTDQAAITTPAFSNADTVHFWIKGVSTDATSALAVTESSDNVTFTAVATINPLPTVGTTYSYHVQSTSTYIKFTYTKSAGNLAFDDFLLTRNATSTNTTSNKIKVYFNHPVNTSVSTGTNAVYLNSKIADTLVSYINKAKYTIDIAIYNFSTGTTMTPVINALNSAYLNRGVVVRYINNGSSNNYAAASLNAGIKRLSSPTSSGYGIMHNKFMVVDANSATASDAFVWTGSTNWDTEQFNADVNNVTVIYNQPLAQAYTAEFNEMWGGTGSSPNTTNSKFGPDKTDPLSTHTFTIDGKTVELYFSPTDGVNNHILSTINSANSDLYFGVYTFTDNTDANAIVTAHNNGVYCAGIMDQYSNTFTPYTTLSTALGSSLFKVYTQSNSIYHNKFVVVDQGNPCSDPMVLTGSHNWTSSANTQNDENTLIIHDATIANIYYQSFNQNFIDLGGTLSPPAVTVTGVSVSPITLSLQVGGSAGQLTATLQPCNATGGLTWSSNHTNIATVSSAGVVTPVAAGSCTITVTTNSGNHTATCAVTVTNSSSIEPVLSVENINIYPNPSNNFIVIETGTTPLQGAKISILNSLGVLVEQMKTLTGNKSQYDISNLKDGIYLLVIDFNGVRSIRKIVVCR